MLLEHHTDCHKLCCFTCEFTATTRNGPSHSVACCEGCNEMKSQNSSNLSVEHKPRRSWFLGIPRVLERGKLVDNEDDPIHHPDLLGRREM